jgi:hypothetical protein
MFDPNTFLDMQVNEANDTHTVPVPEGEYLALVKEIKSRQWVKKDDPSVSGIVLDITWDLQDEGLKALLERKVITVRQSVMLDITDSGVLDMGKGRNIGLGRLREAVNLNIPGTAFSFNQLPGRMAKVSVKHRISDDTIFAEVKAVARA